MSSYDPGRQPCTRACEERESRLPWPRSPREGEQTGIGKNNRKFIGRRCCWSRYRGRDRRWRRLRRKLRLGYAERPVVHDVRREVQGEQCQKKNRKDSKVPVRLSRIPRQDQRGQQEGR